jgi:tetratricopeptide (TPR) repeat protein
MAQAYRKVADVYFQYGEYKEAFTYYRRIFRLGNCMIKPEEYFSQMAISAYFLNEYSELSMFLRNDLEKNKKKTSVDFCIIQDLKVIQMNPKIDHIFRALIDL